MNQQPTLISIFTAFHLLNIPSEIKGNPTALFQALLWKANQLRFPQSFKMSNHELCDHSGLGYNQMFQAREQLSNYKYNNQKMIEYIKGKKDEMATYSINYSIFIQEPYNNDTITIQEPYNNNTITEQQKSNFDCMVSVPFLEKTPKNQHILRQDNTREEKTREDSLSSDVNLVTKSEPIENENESESGFFQNFEKAKRIIQSEYKTFFIHNGSKGLSESQRNMIAYIGSFPEEKVRTIFSLKASKAHDPMNAIIWTAEELERGDGSEKVEKPYEPTPTAEEVEQFLEKVKEDDRRYGENRRRQREGEKTN